MMPKEETMKRIVLTALVYLAGCSSTGPVQIGKDTFMISKQSAAGAFGSSGAVKAEIIQEGSAFCTANKKVFQIVSTSDRPAGYGHNPSAEINFMCLTEGDPELSRPKMRKDPDAVIEVRK